MIPFVITYDTSQGCNMAKQIRVEQTDLETGEVVQMVAIKPTRAPHPFRKEGFVQMSQAAMLELAQNPVRAKP